MGEPIHLQKPRYLKNRSRDLGHVPCGVLYLPLCSTCLGLSDKEKNEVSSVIRAKVMEGSDYLKVGHVTLATPT